MKKNNKMEEIIETICEEIRDFTDVAVVGMSGGADSSLVTILCTLALGKENVFGVHMPATDYDHQHFNNRSCSLAKKLGIQSMQSHCGEIADAICSTVEDTVGSSLNQVNAGNSRSRARMTVLYGISHHLSGVLNKRVRVIGTGNLSEDFIGYDTKGGDALADIFPIGHFLKSEVYMFLDYFKEKGLIEEQHIDRVPSAGLWSGQTDEQELGYSYASMEPLVLELFDDVLLNGEISPRTVGSMFLDQENIDRNLLSFVVDRHSKNKHKHEAPPVIQVRNLLDDLKQND